MRVADDTPGAVEGGHRQRGRDRWRGARGSVSATDRDQEHRDRCSEARIDESAGSVGGHQKGGIEHNHALKAWDSVSSLGLNMPELPDITIYVEALADRIVGQAIEGIRLRTPFLLRSVDPPISELIGKRVTAVRRLGKRIVMEVED